MNIMLLGPAGAGKGSLARPLARDFGFEVFETGAELRKIPELAAELDKGNMAPTPVVMDVLQQALSKGGDRNWVLDGVPRNLEQTEELLPRIQDGRLAIEAVIVLEADEDLLVERLLGRSTCAGCGKIYNEKNNPAPPSGICRCGAPIEVRADDTLPGIKRRHQLYLERTVPSLDRLEEAGIPLHRIDAGRPNDEVVRDVAGRLSLSPPSRTR